MGNPFTYVKYSQLAEVIIAFREAIECYKIWIEFRPDLIADEKKN